MYKGLSVAGLLLRLSQASLLTSFFVSAQRLIFDTENPLFNAKRFVPVYMFITTMVIALVTIKKGLKHVGLHLSNGEAWMWAAVVSAAVMAGGYFYIQKKFANREEDRSFAGVEGIFSVLMVITACAMAFAHGSNDVANAIGPLSAVVSTVEHMGEITTKSSIAWWILPLGGFGIVVGLATLGHKVMATVGYWYHRTNTKPWLCCSASNSMYSSSSVRYRSTYLYNANTGWCGSRCRFRSWYCSP